MAGYILINRDLFDDPAFTSVRFPRPWAVIDLVQMARFKPGTEFVNGRYVSLERGQLCKSVRYLAQRWKWDEKTVSSFLKELSIGGFISFKFPHSKGGLTNIISIVNYNSLASDSHSDSGADSNSKSNTDSDSDSHALYIGNKEEYNTSDTKVSSYSIQENKKEIREAAERLYSMYPSRCPVSRRATGKSSKDKERLERLLKAHTEEELAYKIKRYVKECTEQDSYIKNFATFLNNLPDYSDTTNETTTKTEQQPKKASGFILSSGGLLNKLDY